MDNRANTILSSVISNHGNQLLTSNAFCKVYLTGYLADFPQERHLLTTLKEQELPQVFLDFKETRVTEIDLHHFIKNANRNSGYSTSELAWGVDAWAEAVDLPRSVRIKILKQCFDHTGPISGFAASTHFASEPHSTPVRQRSLAYRTAAAISIAGLVWAIPAKESSHYTQLQSQALTARPSIQATVISPQPSTVAVTLTTRPNATEMLDQTLVSLKQPNSDSTPKPMVLGKQHSRTLKTKQLRADIDAYLQSGL